jgi:hypothetical protein
MRNSNFLLVLCLSFFITVFADNDDGSRHRADCLTREEAHKLRDLWMSFFVHIGDGGVLAGKSVTDDFKLYSQSVNSVTAGIPLSEVTVFPHFKLLHRLDAVVYLCQSTDRSTVGRRPSILQQASFHRGPNSCHVNPTLLRLRCHLMGSWL